MTTLKPAARRNAKFAGVLHLVLQESFVFGSHLCSLPYFDAAGVLADDPVARDALVAAARQVMIARGVSWVELRQSEALDKALPVRRDKVRMELRLAAASEALWKVLSPKVRNQVRKGERANLEVCEGGAELIPEFYRVYCRNMRDLGSPPHSLRFFHLAEASFRDQVRLFLVRLGGQTVAGSFTLADPRGLHVPWAASDWRLRHLCPNMLLYWKMLAYACDSGLPSFDFGRSTRDEGTYRFKKQWGAEEVQLYWHYLLPDGAALPGLRPDSPKYRLMVACWKKLPLWAVRTVGPRIIRKLA